PPAYDQQGVSINDLIDFTPELRAEAVKLVSLYKIGPLFTPPVVSKWEGPRGTIMSPTATGGANWQGGSFDPETKMFYIFTNTGVTSLGLVPEDPARGDFGWSQGTARDPNAPPPPPGGGRGGRGRGAEPGAAPAGGAPAGGAPAAAGGQAPAGGGR